MSARPKVVIVHPSDEMYGADRMLLQVIAALDEHTDADVEVWLPGGIEHPRFPLCDELTARGVTWSHRALPVMRRSELTPVGLARLLVRCARLWRDLRRSDAAVVHLGTSACLLGAPTAWLARVPRRILHVQERWSGGEARVLRLLARFTNCRVAISEYVAGTCGLDDPPPVVIPNCVDDLGAGAALDPPGSHGGPLRYVVASRWNTWKGHGTLIRAWETAAGPGRLTVLGGPPPLGEAVDVADLVQQMVTDRSSVQIAGEVADVRAAVGEADVLVLPSDEPEPFGLVVIEAFALGRPVIASRAGGPLEVIEDGVTGWFYELGDADDLARVITSLDADAVRTAGRHARDTYERRFAPAAYRREFGALMAEQLAAATHRRRGIRRRRG